MTKVKDYLDITEEIKEAIISISTTEPDGRKVIRLGNYALDFTQPYYLNGFTKKGVKLSWINGRDEINIIGKVYEAGDDRPQHKLVTEGWRYIQRFYTKSDIEKSGMVNQ